MKSVPRETIPPLYAESTSRQLHTNSLLLMYRGGSVLESRHVFAFWAITLFNATTYFLIRAVCHQIALEAEDVEAQVSLKQVQGASNSLRGGTMS